MKSEVELEQGIKVREDGLEEEEDRERGRIWSTTSTAMKSIQSALKASAQETEQQLWEHLIDKKLHRHKSLITYHLTHQSYPLSRISPVSLNKQNSTLPSPISAATYSSVNY
jgi:hypothetical protein